MAMRNCSGKRTRPYFLLAAIAVMVSVAPAFATSRHSDISSSRPAHETGFLDRSLAFSGARYHFQVYLPAQWARQKKWPIILFLHGYGESGSDGLASSDVGLPSAIRQNPARYPFIVVMPQCPWQHWWADDDMARMALAALDQSVKEFNGDRERLYLTGLSMGGYGSWYIASHFPGKFAAIAPVCGALRAAWDSVHNQAPGVFDQTARAIGKTPVWIFHGDADDAVPVEESRRMYAALRQSGGNVRYYEYEGVHHDSWNHAYREPDFAAWLLSHTLHGAAAADAQMKKIPRHPMPAVVDAGAYPEYAGTYQRQIRAGVMTIATVSSASGELSVQISRGDSAHLLPFSAGEFFAEGSDGGVTYIFQRDTAGKVTSLAVRDFRHDEVYDRVP